MKLKKMRLKMNGIVAVLSYYIGGISSELNTTGGSRKGKIIPLFKIVNYVYEILLGLHNIHFKSLIQHYELFSEPLHC